MTDRTEHFDAPADWRERIADHTPSAAGESPPYGLRGLVAEIESWRSVSSPEGEETPTEPAYFLAGDAENRFREYIKDAFDLDAVVRQAWERFEKVLTAFPATPSELPSSPNLGVRDGDWFRMPPSGQPRDLGVRPVDNHFEGRCFGCSWTYTGGGRDIIQFAFKEHDCFDHGSSSSPEPSPSPNLGAGDSKEMDEKLRWVTLCLQQELGGARTDPGLDWPDWWAKLMAVVRAIVARDPGESPTPSLRQVAPTLGVGDSVDVYMGRYCIGGTVKSLGNVTGPLVVVADEPQSGNPIAPSVGGHSTDTWEPQEGERVVGKVWSHPDQDIEGTFVRHGNAYASLIDIGAAIACTVVRESLRPSGVGEVATPPAAKCICPKFVDTGGFGIADLCCPVHGVDGADPGDGFSYDEPAAAPAATDRPAQ